MFAFEEVPRLVSPFGLMIGNVTGLLNLKSMFDGDPSEWFILEDYGHGNTKRP